MGGLQDRTGASPLKLFSHVKITHPLHQASESTGTVIRIDAAQRKVWIALPDGRIVPAGHRSVEVIVPRAQRG